MTTNVCQKCQGVPVHPEIPECHGCFDCDHTGTRVGFDYIQRMWAEAAGYEVEYLRRGVCSDCLACSAKEAEIACRPQRDCTGEYGCAGDRLWQL